MTDLAAADGQRAPQRRGQRRDQTSTPPEPGLLAFGDAVAVAAEWMTLLAEDDGPDVRVNAHVKIVEEAEEVRDAPDDIEEAADVAIVLTALCLQRGWTFEMLADAVSAKIAKNRTRTWEMSPAGVWHHVKTPPTQENTREVAAEAGPIVGSRP